MANVQDHLFEKLFGFGRLTQQSDTFQGVCRAKFKQKNYKIGLKNYKKVAKKPAQRTPLSGQKHKIY